MKELEDKLNKEYQHIGKIIIKEMHNDNILISDIDYIPSVMVKIKPLDIDEPIIVAKKYHYSEKYDLIDGYHRLKSKILKGNSVDVIILDDYDLKRKYDTLFSFLEQFVGKSIKFLDDTLVLVDDRYYQIESNEGCGGCSNGWSSLDILPEFLNKKITIKSIESKDSGKEYDDIYELVINGKVIAKVDTGYGNGYYGGDFVINHIS